MNRQAAIMGILGGLAAAIGIVSGIGSTCTTFDSAWWRIPSFAIIADFQLVFLATYLVTWLVAIVWAILTWALWAGKPWLYKSALITAIAGFVSGFIPVIILLYGSFSNRGLRFTPSWFRTIINAVIIVVLLIPQFRNGIRDHIKEKSSSSKPTMGSDVASFSFVLFGFGIMLMIQPFIMPWTHIINSVNIGYDYEALQFYAGLISILIGIFLQLTGRFLNYISSPIKTPTKA